MVRLPLGLCFCLGMTKKNQLVHKCHSATLEGGCRLHLVLKNILKGGAISMREFVFR